MRAPIDIALVETYGTPLDDTTLARAVADPFIRRVAVFTWNHHPGLVDEVLVDGVSGYLGKNLTAAQLGRALRADPRGPVRRRAAAPGACPRRAWPRRSEADMLTTASARPWPSSPPVAATTRSRRRCGSRSTR